MTDMVRKSHGCYLQASGAKMEMGFLLSGCFYGAPQMQHEAWINQAARCVRRVWHRWM